MQQASDLCGFACHNKPNGATILNLDKAHCERASAGMVSDGSAIERRRKDYALLALVKRKPESEVYWVSLWGRNS